MGSVAVLNNVEAVLAASEKATLEADASLSPDGLEAILAASQEAIAAAEATLLSEDIERKLTFTSVAKTTVPESYAIYEEIVTQDVTTSPTAPSVITEEEPPLEAPGVRRILRFAIPAIGVWLCGPLLSLIDTGAVGLLGGTVQQAALNPAVAVTDYSALLLSFLFTGSTNLIAASQESDRRLDGSPRTTRTLIGALQLSSLVGIVLGAATYAGASGMLRSIIGNDGISPDVFDSALKYVRIRALGVPAAAVIGSAQAACLGMQDVRSPLYVLATAAIVNFVGDMLFVGCKHPWIGGAAGAAWATVFSQFAALAMFVRWLTASSHRSPAEVLSSQGKTKVLNVSNAILELTGKPSSAGAGRRERFRETLRQFRLRNMVSLEAQKDKLRSHGRLSMVMRPLQLFRGKMTVDTSQNSRENDKLQNLKSSPPKFSTRGFLFGKFRGQDLLKVPEADTFRNFRPYLVPVTSTVVGRVSGFVAMSHVVSSAMGTASMAAQQVILSFFQCICPIADSLSLTAQSFVPGILQRRPGPVRTRILRKTKMNFFKASVGFGLAMAVAVANIPLVSGWFSSDPTVVSLINKCVPLLAAWFSMHGVMCASEGLLLGQKDLSFLGRMYAMWFAVVPYLMLRVKRAAIVQQTSTVGRVVGGRVVDLTTIWQVFLMYQFLRSSLWAIRAALYEQSPRQSSSSGVGV
jgi:Na+-driven multidrug efflux pump